MMCCNLFQNLRQVAAAFFLDQDGGNQDLHIMERNASRQVFHGDSRKSKAKGLLVVTDAETRLKLGPPSRGLRYQSRIGARDPRESR